MSHDQWKSRLGWLGMVAAILICSPLAQAQQEEVEVDVKKDVLLIVDDDDAPKPRPWLGLHCVPVDAALRAHVKLPEGQGLVVGSLAPDSPAMKAGIQVSDILLKAGDQSLKEVSDLVKALEQSDGKPLAIELVRSGETKTIEVTPGERQASEPVVEPLAPHDEALRWLERAREVPRIFEGLPERMRFLRAGIPVAAPFPKDLSLSITKDGDAPAKIVVKKGEEQWETTENTLGDLPKSVRGHVETFLGKPQTVPFNISLPPQGAVPPEKPEHPEAARAPRAGGGGLADRGRDAESRARRAAEEGRRRVEEAERRIRDQVAPQAERFGRRIEELERQLQERLEKLDQLIDERTRAIEAAPAKPATPATPATPAQPAKPAPESGPTLPQPEET